MRYITIVLAASVAAGQEQGGPDPGRQEPSRQGQGRQEPSRQGQGAFVKVDLRVTAPRDGGSVIVDRGSDAGVALGDLVVLRLRTGATLEGTVVELDERSAVVELATRTAAVPVGSRGEVLVPSERLATAAPVDPAAPEHPPWNEDTWRPGMPLLAGIEPVRPEERASLITGRLYAFGDGTYTDGDRSDSFLRSGGSLFWDNPLGRGGQLHIDAELNQRSLALPDDEEDDDGSETRLRIDRLSYAWGGDRFMPERWEVGRALHYGMPEFGVVDGLQYGQRLASGDRWGTSFGHAPDPFEEFDERGDFQVAGWYEWVADETERLTAAGGLQKKFGDSDRELVVGRLRYLPPDGWNFNGTVWVDRYGGDDEEKDSGLELTQAFLSTGRRWESGNGMNVTFSHIRFPELGQELDPVVAADLADARNDRLAVSGWRLIGDGKRLYGEVGAWDDEDDSGADAEIAVEVPDLWVDRSRTTLAVFNTRGRFSDVAGARLGYGWGARAGRWDVFYEIARNEQAGFADDTDDILQQRLRASRSFRAADWDVSLFGEGLFWDEESSWSLGFYVQRSF